MILELCQNEVHQSFPFLTSQSLSKLRMRRKKFHELEVQCYVVQIINALKYLQSKHIIHGEFSPLLILILVVSNQKISSSTIKWSSNSVILVKLIYIVSKEIRKGITTKFNNSRFIRSTPNYIAPEILLGDKRCSYEVDVWSLGIIM
jgi:serine/threonine protein kinase